MKLTFLGGAGTVTGSKFLVESRGARVLVDCGLFQGIKALRLRNWQGLPVDPGSLDAVILTHAHVDHSGYLPRLVVDGFDGPIVATAPTAALCRILLPDSGHLQEEDARYANTKRFTRHQPALPLYTEDDARAMLGRFHEIEMGEEFAVGDLRVRLSRAGHILGATSALVTELSDDGARRSILFSGDLGRPNDLLMHPPAPPPAADWVVMESTYGDRAHAEVDPVEDIAGILNRTMGRGGVLLIPSFAVGRAQTLLFCLNEIFRRGLAREIPVFLNSPMATSVTDLYQRFIEHHKLSAERCADVCDMATFVRSVEESKELTQRWFPMVIISASGMATGGRVLHHLKALLPDHRNTVLLPGYQAPGTRGWSLANGADEVKIHGGWIPVRAEVVTMDVLSAHADRRELLAWLGSMQAPPRKVFLVHGEPAAADSLRLKVRDGLQLDVDVAEAGQQVTLE